MSLIGNIKWYFNNVCLYTKSNVNVGINTNNADEKLTVNGNIRTTDTLIATDIDTSFITLDYIEFNNLSSPPSNTTRKLYVVNGNLYFDGNLVSMSII